MDDHTNTVALSPDGRRIVTASTTGDAQVWDAGSGELLGPLGTNRGEVHAVRFHPEGTRIAVAGGDGTIRLFDPQTLEEIVHLRGQEAYVSVRGLEPRRLDARFRIGRRFAPSLAHRVREAAKRPACSLARAPGRGVANRRRPIPRVGADRRRGRAPSRGLRTGRQAPSVSSDRAVRPTIPLILPL